MEFHEEMLSIITNPACFGCWLSFYWHVDGPEVAKEQFEGYVGWLADMYRKDDEERLD